MFNIQILEDHDTITEDTYIRPLNIFYDNGGMSDYAGQESMYTGTPQNRMTWTEITRKAPVWVGKTVKEYNERVGTCGGVTYVFCQGDLPNKMISALTESEFKTKVYQKYLDTTIIPWVKKYKLKGETLSFIQQRDKEYFHWLMDQEGVITLGDMYSDYLDYHYEGEIPQESHEFAWITKVQKQFK